MKVTVERKTKKQKPLVLIPLIVRPKYLINIKVNRKTFAFRFTIANPARLWWNRKIRKRHDAIREGILKGSLS